ncbi:MAG: AI-2E family transporter [Nitrospirota bacterium]|nr:AI-2E family transporter [Nitrospirota bacterium]
MKVTRKTGLPVLATMGWVVIVVAGMRAADAVLIPLMLSVFLAVICAGPVFWLESKKVPSALGVALVILGVVLLGLIIGAMIGTSVNDFSEALPRYEARLQSEMDPVFTWLQQSGVTISSQDLLNYVDPGAAMKLGTRMLSGLGQMFTNTFLILLTVIFMLAEACVFTKKLQVIWGGEQGAFGAFTKFGHDVQHLLAIKTWMSLGTGLAVGLWVAVLGVDFPVLWGVLAFLLNYIPNLGSIIAGAPAVLLAFVQFGGVRALIVAGGYVVINIIFGNVVEPKLMGRRLGLSTLTVFLSLVFWGWVWGPVGMILSVPLTMVLKIALESREDTKWMALFLGSDAALKEATAGVVVQPDAKST